MKTNNLKGDMLIFGTFISRRSNRRKRRRFFINIFLILSISVCYFIILVKEGNCQEINTTETKSMLTEKYDGLVAYWSFDEGKGEIAFDYSGNSNHLEMRSVKWTEGICGQGIFLERNSRCFCAYELESCFVFLDDYTIEVWVKHTTKESQIYVSKWAGSGNMSGWWLGYYDGRVQFGDYYDGGQSRIKGPDIADNQWHYVVGVRKGTNLYLFVDGENVAKGTSAGKVAGDNIAPVRIGGFGTGGYIYWQFKGLLDEVRIYCRAIDENEIKERYEIIKNGLKQITLQPISEGLPLLFYGRMIIASIYSTNQPVEIFLTMVSSKPTSIINPSIIIKNSNGKIVKKINKKFIPQENKKFIKTYLSFSHLKEGKYNIEVSIERKPILKEEITVKNIKQIVSENIKIKEERAKESSFYRGIVSAYAGMIYKKDGTPDIDSTISLIKELGVNCYTYLICSHSEKELTSLGEFCDRARKEGIEVWVYLVPPSEAPINRDKPISERKYPPFDMDYLKWADAIAKISLQYPNITLWMIDDYDGNLNFFTVEYTRQIYEKTKNINPKLLFGVCVYHESLKNFSQSGYLPYVDALLWGYQHSAVLYPECGIFPNTLPFEINDYLKTGKIAIPCIYFSPHSSWPKDKPTKEYLEEAMKISFQQSGICWVFTTPKSGTFQYDVVKNFTNIYLKSH